MRNPPRKLPFVLAASNHGPMIVSRLDYKMVAPGQGIGVGYQILETGHFDPQEISLAIRLLLMLRRRRGEGVTAIDCGANIGVHTIEWAVAMTAWGKVVAIEAQERLYYALAGNVALNNCFNARAIHGAVGAASGTLEMPAPSYMTPSSYGSLELRQSGQNEDIGQAIDYSAERTVSVRQLTIDELNLPRVDFIKIDIEGMEVEALTGAEATINRSRPVMMIEAIKVSPVDLIGWLQAHGYETLGTGINILAIHKEDPVLADFENPH